MCVLRKYQDEVWQQQYLAKQVVLPSTGSLDRQLNQHLQQPVSC